MKFELPPLPYAYDALEPVIDARTMELHHSKHHATYVAKLNEALEKAPELAEKSLALSSIEGLEEMLADLDSLPPAIHTAVRNHGGGHHNHSLFWQMMRASRENNAPEGVLLDAITSSFGDFEKFKEQFTKDALGIFGSGWCWIVKDEVGALKIITTLNQDSPLMQKLVPILGLDVWEHAYYLKHQNRRADYIASWWGIVNWEFCATRL